jgi:hypothetical protein
MPVSTSSFSFNLTYNLSVLSGTNGVPLDVKHYADYECVHIFICFSTGKYYTPVTSSMQNYEITNMFVKRLSQ